MRLIYSLLLLLVLVGCMPPSENQLRMEMDLEEMKRRLAQLEVQSAEAAQEEVAGGDTLQRQNAELLAGLDNLRVELQSTNGRIDDLARDNRSLADELALIREDLELRISSLSERMDQLEQQMARNPQPEEAAAAPAQAPEASAAELSAEELYQEALRAIRQDSDFERGRRMLERFVERYPDHELYVNALYWQGEALYGEKNYELAILQFQDVISQYPDHSKAPAAMLKQALAFNALGDAPNARTTMEKLITEYPQAQQAAAARKYLEQLGE